MTRTSNTHILMNSDTYGWSIFKPTDEVKLFDGEIETGMYFIITSNYFPLKGNGCTLMILLKRL